jgi:hypothetical protein
MPDVSLLCAGDLGVEFILPKTEISLLALSAFVDSAEGRFGRIEFGSVCGWLGLLLSGRLYVRPLRRIRTLGKFFGLSSKPSFDPTARRNGVSGCANAAFTVASSVVIRAWPSANKFWCVPQARNAAA